MASGDSGELAMGGVALSEIAGAVGTPTYMYDARAIRGRHSALAAALRPVPHRILYAVKANANLAVLGLLARLGAGADIVSGGELLRALAAGFPAESIVFSGAGKTDEELTAAVAARIGCINAESVGELRRIALICELSGQDATVGIRVNPDVAAATHPYIATGKGGLKFGVPLAQFNDALRVIDASSRLRLGAVAMHIGSQILHTDPYVAGLRRLIDLIGEARGAGHVPDLIDVGGGLGIRYREERPLEPAEWIAPLCDTVRSSGCTLQIAFGRYLVGSAGILLARVIDTKCAEGRRIAVIDAGMNDLLRPALYQAWHAVVPVRPSPGEMGRWDVVGPVCETGDFIGFDREMPQLGPGDLVAILGAGAYGFAMSSNYNSRARAAEVMVDDGTWRVVRPRERLADLYRDEPADPFGHGSGAS
ncbi:MAG: diaminopimelate decarboxylase [Gemmatimonadales bacterium]